MRTGWRTRSRTTVRASVCVGVGEWMAKEASIEVKSNRSTGRWGLDLWTPIDHQD
jgi:hypothetical protein